MKRRLLSVLLAVAMICGTAMPVFQCLPTAFTVDAASEILSTGNSVIKVNTFAELKYALKYAEENSVIVLDDDIMVDSLDMEVEVGTGGMLTLDLNGMYFSAENNGASFIRLTDSTNFYLIDSSDGNGHLGVTINDKENASIISLENPNAELHMYGVSIGLTGASGSTDNDGSAIIKFKQFKSFTAYGISASAGACDSSAISFEPVSENEFASSSVYMTDAKLSAYDYCITFTRNPEFDDFFMKDSFASFCVEMNEFKSVSGGSGYIFDTNGVSDVTIADILPENSLVLRASDNSVISGTTALYDIDCDVKSVIDRDSDGSFTSADSCEYAGAGHIKNGNFKEILHSPFAHFRQCTKCTEMYAFAHITAKTDYVAPGENTEGRTAGEYCIDSKHDYDSSVAIPAKNHIADTKNMIYINTAEDLIKAMYFTEPGLTLCLANDLFINLDSYDGLVLCPQARGDLTIDLNGNSIYFENSKSYYLFRLNSASESGAIRLHIVNSEPEAESEIVYRSNEYAFAMFLLEHPAVGLYIYPDVKITNELLSISDYVAAMNIGVNTVSLYSFNEFEIYGAEIINNTPDGNCINFSSTHTDYSKASVTINSAVLRSAGSCINFNALSADNFPQFDASDTYFAATVKGNTPRLAATGDITVGDILAKNQGLCYAFNFEQQVKFSKAINTLNADSEIIISRGLNARCEEHQTREILIDGRFHYLKCDLCDNVTERAEHDRIVPDEEGSCSMNVYREYDCDCGACSVISFNGHNLKYVAATKNDCSMAGYFEYYECRDCGALFESPYSKTERDISYFYSPATEHNCVILLEKLDPDCDDFARRIWECSNKNCDYRKTTYDNNEWPTGHSSIGGLIRVSTHDGLAATCTTKGYSGTYYTCSKNDACGAMYKDSALTEEITEDELDIPALGHDFSDGFEYVFDATCVDSTVTKATCKTCGYEKFEVIEAEGHYFSEGTFIYQSCEDLNVKEYKCDFCDTRKYEKSYPEVPHKYDDITIVTPPSCTGNGTRKITCSNEWCGDFYTENIDPLGGHSLSYRNAKPATCTASGTIAYYECSGQFGCGEKFLDAAGTVPVADVTDPIKEHNLYFEKEEAPTCTTKGVKAHYRCETGCGLYFSDDTGTLTTPDALWIDAQHTPGNWEITKIPSPASPGVESLKCAICKEIISTRNVPYVAPEYILGDVDMNGSVDAADARFALRAAVKLDSLSDIQSKAADADKNGIIEANDARLILRHTVGLEDLK